MPSFISRPGFLKYFSTLDLKAGGTLSPGIIQLQGLFGEINVNSTPPKANIYFDGNLIPPKTPVTINKVPRDRKHSLRIQLDGYETWETTIDMSAEADKKYMIELKKK
ncbi:MAG: PEGA domain-containing protein [Deltaproteobacteria bacterium]|nr:PEGA domain-containing protein [Deltaproteobacteria bacterium]